MIKAEEEMNTSDDQVASPSSFFVLANMGQLKRSSMIEIGQKYRTICTGWEKLRVKTSVSFPPLPRTNNKNRKNPAQEIRNNPIAKK